MSLFLKGLETLLETNPYTSGVGSLIFGNDDESVVDPVVDEPSEEDFSFLNDLFTDQDTTDYSYLFDDVTDLTPNMPNTGISSFDISSLFGDDDDYSYLFDDDYSFTPGTNFDAQKLIDNMFGTDTNMDMSVSNNNNNNLSEDDYRGILGLGVGPKLKDFFIGSDDDPGFLQQVLFGKASGKDGSKSGGVAGILEGLLGGGENQGFLSSPLVKLLLANYLSKKDESPAGIVPVGQAAFASGSQGLGNMPDYRVFNIQPALMPGVAYANAPPPEMKHGGVHGAGKREGPGDITLARLEPGEFVMTRKATENLGARNLYKLMKQAERMG